MSTTPFMKTFLLAVAISALTFCKSDDESTGQISVAVTDSLPVDYADAIVVQFTGVELKPKIGPAFSRDFVYPPNTIDLLADPGRDAARRRGGPGRRVHKPTRSRCSSGSRRGRRLLHHDRRRRMRTADSERRRTRAADDPWFSGSASASLLVYVDFYFRTLGVEAAGPPDQASRSVMPRLIKLKPVLRVVDNLEVGAITGTI